MLSELDSNINKDDSSDDIQPAERFQVHARIEEVPDELIESSRINLPPLGHPGNRVMNNDRISHVILPNKLQYEERKVDHSSLV